MEQPDAIIDMSDEYTPVATHDALSGLNMAPGPPACQASIGRPPDQNGQRIWAARCCSAPRERAGSTKSGRAHP